MSTYQEQFVNYKIKSMLYLYIRFISILYINNFKHKIVYLMYIFINL